MTEIQGCECLHESSEGVAGAFNFIVVIVILPLLSLVGVFFNILNIQIFSQQKNTAAKYLTALSCSDVGVCIAGILVICSDSLRAYVFWIDQLFVFLLPKLIPLGLYFQMLSVYITVLAAFDCFYSVFRGSRGDPIRDIWAPKVLAGVVIAVALYSIVQFLELEAVHCMHPELNFTLYELCPTEFRLSDTYVVVYKGYMYALSMAIVPFVLLSSLTVGIVALLRRHVKMHRIGEWTQLLPAVDHYARRCVTASENEQEEGNSPIVLLLVILLFLICNVTSLLVNVFDMMKISVGDDAEMILIDVGNFLVVFNATANFIVYYFSSPEYRQAADDIFQKIFTDSPELKRKGDLMTPAGDFL